MVHGNSLSIVANDNLSGFKTLFSNSNEINPLNAKLIKWSNTLKQIVGKLPTICLSVFDHFSGLALKGLKLEALTMEAYKMKNGHAIPIMTNLFVFQENTHNIRDFQGFAFCK